MAVAPESVSLSTSPTSRAATCRVSGSFARPSTYDGANGYSLRLQGLEPGFNDRAFDRAIVMHGAPYVSQDLIRKQGGLAAAGVAPRCVPPLPAASSIR